MTFKNESFVSILFHLFLSIILFLAQFVYVRKMGCIRPIAQIAESHNNKSNW